MVERASAFRPLHLVFLLLGLGFLAAVLWRVDLDAVIRHVGAIGWGIVAVLAIHLVAFLADTVSWRSVFPRERLKDLSFHALWKVRMVGAALNRVTPVVGLAGEPVKAILLRKYHNVGYQEGAASLVLAKTANLIALVIFLAGGLGLALAAGQLPAGTEWPVIAAFGTLSFGIFVLFLVQRLRLSSAAASWLAKRRLGRPLAKAIQHIQALDHRFVENYTRDRRRFAIAVLLTLVNWAMGAVELWITLWLLGYPISMVEAWGAEAAVELVRAATFFIPASIGAQEAAYVLVLGPIIGQPPLGLAVAVIRRFREIVWIIWGFVIAWAGFRPADASQGET
ncbi:flippase-like domain-containing protein [bacterium AH-315-B06]|nr:flippase-like domain-containing protein [bacterium AH-315-B06]